MCFLCAANPNATPGAIYDPHVNASGGTGSGGSDRSSAPFTWDQIASQLTDGYWNFNGGQRFSFDVSVDRILTVDLSRLSSAATAIAQNALSQWSAATGITFTSVGVAPSAFSETADALASTATQYTITTNSVVTGSISNGDVDYYKVFLTAGQSYMVGMSGYAAGSTLDSIIQVLDSSGNAIPGLPAVDSQDPAAGEYLTFTASTSGFYYLSADGYQTSTGNYQLSIQTAADITFNDMDNTGAYAYSDIGGPLGQTTLRSYVNIADDWSPLSMNSYMLQTYIHEIGHALGLGHAGNYNGNANWPTDALYDNDSWLATVMSYFDQVTNTNVPGDFAYLATIMPADIIAIQNLYGAGPSGYQTGNTVWGPGGNLGNTLQTMMNMWANLVPDNPAIYDNQPMAFTIYDTAGTDTMDFSAFSQAQEILLTELQYSNIGGLIDNVVIARGTVIENARGGAGADTITGNDIANTLYGNSGIDTLYGGIGADTLYGGNDGDTLYGGVGADFLKGDAGTNTLYGGNDDDTFYGGAGIDTMLGEGGLLDLVNYNGSLVGVNVNLATNVNTGGDAQGDSLSGIERVIGSYHNDTITGDGNNNFLFGLGGIDTFYGGNGNDQMQGGDADDNFYGGLGADRIYGDAGYDKAFYGTSAAGVTINLATNGNAGGEAAGDYFLSIEEITGSNFADAITGSAVSETFFGGTGIDALYGGGAGDYLYGGNDNDNLFGGTGGDRLDGQAGTLDMAYYDTSASGVTVNLATNVNSGGDAAGDTLFNIERVSGSAHADSLTGDGAVNYLYGQNGADTINGGLGGDILYGGANNDTFRFTETNFGADVIVDFTDTGAATDDRLSFALSVADNFNDFTFVGNGTTSVTVTIIGGQTFTVRGPAAITLDASDFVFV